MMKNMAKILFFDNKNFQSNFGRNVLLLELPWKLQKIQAKNYQEEKICIG